MGHFHGHSDHALQASYHHLVLGVARHSLASGFHPGQASPLFEAKGNRVKTLSFFPGLDLRAVVDLSRPYDCPDLSVFDLDVPVHWARRASDFILGTPGLTLVVVTSLPDDDLLGSLALDPRTPGVSPQGRGLRSPLSLSRIAKTIKISIVRTMGP